MKSIFMTFFVSFMILVSQLLLKKGITNVVEKGTGGGGLGFLLDAFLSSSVLSALVVQVAGYILWMFVIARLKLAMAFAISGAFLYILLAFAGWFFFGEKLTVLRWVGLFLISTGILCMNLRVA